MRLRSLKTYDWVNVVGIACTLFLICGIYSLIIYFVCPAIYEPDECVFMTHYGAIIIVELLVNFFLFVIYSRRNDPQRWFQNNTVLITQKGAGNYCLECNRIRPLRSHHCRLCNMCVLRKDHHCFLTGACVGIANQRFFIVFVWWASIGTAFGSSFLLMYLLQYVESDFYPFGWTKFLAPVAIVRWLLSYETFTNTVMCTAFSISSATCIIAVLFFGSQMFYTLSGYTMYDYHTLSRKFELHGDGERYSERLRMIFGHYWIINFIFPLLCCQNQLTENIAQNLFASFSKDM